RIAAKLGAGGMGEVYRAVHERLGRQVAIKTLKPQAAADHKLLQRFFGEARVVNEIRHENIVEVTDLVEAADHSGQPSYMVMELLEGRTLTQAIRQAGRITPHRCAYIGAQIADAIAAAHALDVVHRDLKPDNVFLIRRQGSPDYVKILDFGIARLQPEMSGLEATQSGVVIGTPAYMSPEQASGKKVTGAADIYALGVILFHMLTGRLPFEGPSLPEVLYGHMRLEPPPIHTLAPDVPTAMAELVVRMMAKRVAQRPADMHQVRGALLTSVGIDPTASLAKVSALAAAAASERDPRARSGAWGGDTVDATGPMTPGALATPGDRTGDHVATVPGILSPGRHHTPGVGALSASGTSFGATLDPIAADSLPSDSRLSDSGAREHGAPAQRRRVATPQSVPVDAMRAGSRWRAPLFIGATVLLVAGGLTAYAVLAGGGGSGDDSGVSAADALSVAADDPASGGAAVAPLAA
ncbi:MAG: serine/threonine-protein kinase, partial [Myxococcota bacterium]